MLCRVFSTAQYVYRDVPVTLFPDLEGTYNTGILPNEEQIGLMLGLWEDERGIVNLLASFDIVHWPSYRISRLQFNAVSGSYVGAEDEVGWGSAPANPLYWQSVVKARDGSLWVKLSTGAIAKLARVVKRDYYYQQLTEAAAIGDATAAELLSENELRETFDYTGDEYAPADYSLAGFGAFGIADDVLLHGGTRKIDVYTGTTLTRSIYVPSTPVAFAYDDDLTRWFTLLQNGAVVGFDYADGRILQYTQLQLGYDIAAEDVLFTWVRRYRRFLIVRSTADVAGECTVRIHGYRNRPIATHVCEPVPTTPIRQGRTVDFLSRQIGDAGEPIAGQITVDAATALTVARSRVAVDGDGDALISALCGASGAAGMDVSIEVACTVDSPNIDNPFNTPEA